MSIIPSPHIFEEPVAAIYGRIAAVRRFNRFYTRQIGVLRQGLLDSPFSLTEVRVLYEIGHRVRPTATDLCRELAIDPGYLSRVVRQFEKKGLLTKHPSEKDGRQSLLELTSKGRQTFAELDDRSNHEVSELLKGVSRSRQTQLVSAMRTIEGVLKPDGKPQSEKSAYVLRGHQPGDMGWIVHRHGVLYSREYGYDERFEALVAKIAAEFIENFDPKRERCWIAEKDGEIVGCIFLVRQSKAVAKLRLLLVEPSARGLGLGKRLVAECVRFARQVGYKKIVLWTQSELGAARHLYELAGFRLRAKEPHHSWGRQLVAETWELKLQPAR